MGIGRECLGVEWCIVVPTYHVRIREGETEVWEVWSRNI
jgi:hypothetical protein